MEKRYQGFVSSTYTDLTEERAAVMRGLLALRCIPAGMELFGAVDQEQLPLIQGEIALSDYFVVIIGDRYGSLTDEGLSFTEAEYDFAFSRKIPILGFIHSQPETLSVRNSESNPKLVKRLIAFRTKVQKGRMVQPWTVSAELAGLVITNLTLLRVVSARLLVVPLARLVA